MIPRRRTLRLGRAVASVALAACAFGAGAPAMAAGIPTRSDVINVIDKHLKLVAPKVDPAQRSKIMNFAGAFPSGGGCPGYRFLPGGGHVETTDRNGALLQAGFEAVFKGQFAVAEWCFLLAAHSNPECSVFTSNAAFTLSIFKDYADALTLLNYNIVRDPLFASAWVNIGYASKELKDFDAAKSAYQMAIGLNPQIEEYRSALRRVYEAAGEKKKVDQAKLDEALRALGDTGAGGQGRAGGGKKKTPSSSGGAAQGSSRIEFPPAVVEARDPSMIEFDPVVVEASQKLGQSYEKDISVLEQFVGPIQMMAGATLRESQWHLEQSKETSGITKSVHQTAGTAWSLYSQLFRGYLQEITGSWETAQTLTELGFVRVGHRPKDYNPIKGLAPEMKLPPISVGFDGFSFKFIPGEEEIEFEFGEGVIFGVFANKEGWGVKLGVGVMAEGAVLGAEAAYFIKYQSTKGWGDELKLAGHCAGVQVEVPLSEYSFAFEKLDWEKARGDVHPERPLIIESGKP